MIHPIRWQRVPAGLISFKSLGTELPLAVCYAIAYAASGFLIGWAILRYPLPILGATQFNQDFWYSGVFKIGLLLGITSVVYFGMWKYRIGDLLLGARFTWKTLLAGVVLVCIGFNLNAGHLPAIQAKFSEVDSRYLRLFLGIVMPLFTAGIPEELFFRGILQTRLEKRFNTLVAMVIATLLFVAWHLPTRYLLSAGVEGQAGDWGGVVLNTGVPVFIVGLLFAAHWSRYRNIVLLIVTHWAIDILPSVSSYFGIRF